MTSSSRGPLLGYYNETGDDFIDSYQLRALFTGPFVEHHSRISDVSRGIRNRLEIKQWQRVREIGRGGFGTVHLETERGGAVRAVKEIPKFTHKTRTMDHLREILAMAHFSAEDTFFIRLHGWFQDQTSIFIAMEYAPHGDLEECVKENLPEPEVQTIAVQLVEALTLMHQKNFTHRDLKPSNVFVVSKGLAWWVKLGDFGVSKRVRDDSTSMHTSIETEYTAPEISGFVGDGSEESSKYTNAVDMWSLGCLLHWLLTQRLPLSKWDMMPFCSGSKPFPAQHLSKQFVSPEGINFIQKLMTPQPHERMNAFEALEHGWPREYFDIDGHNVQPSSSDSVNGPSSNLTGNPLEYSTGITHTESLDVKVLNGPKLNTDEKIGDKWGPAFRKIIQGNSARRDGHEMDMNNFGPDLSILNGLKVEGSGMNLDTNGKPLGKLAAGGSFDLYGTEMADDEKISNEDGDVVGEAGAMPQEVLAKENASVTFGNDEQDEVDQFIEGVSQATPDPLVQIKQDASPNSTEGWGEFVLDTLFAQVKQEEAAKLEETVRMNRQKHMAAELIELQNFHKTLDLSSSVPKSAQIKPGEAAKLNERLRKDRQKDMAAKLIDLQKFSKSFKLSSPVPADLLPILTKSPAQQEEIRKRSYGTRQTVEVQPQSSNEADSPVDRPPNAHSRGSQSSSAEDGSKNRNETHNTDQRVVVRLPAPSRPNHNTAGQRRKGMSDTAWPPRPTATQQQSVSGRSPVSWAAVAAGRPKTDNIGSASPRSWRHSPQISRRSGKKGAVEAAVSSNESPGAGRTGTSSSDHFSLYVDTAKPGGPRSSTIYVRNLPWATSREDLFELFCTVWPVSRAEIQYANGRHQGSGIVDFKSVAAADSAIVFFSGYSYGGRPLDLSYAKY